MPKKRSTEPLHNWASHPMSAYHTYCLGLNPDMIDALTFTSPTPFSPFGVVAMWAIFAVALLASLRRRLGLRPRTWRIAHMLLAIVIVVGSVVHGILIEGTMETVSKAALCALVLAATIKVMADLRVWRKPVGGSEPKA